MVTTAEFAAVASATAVTIGVVIALLQLRNLLKIRQTDLVIRLFSSMWDPSFQKSYVHVLGWKYDSFEGFKESAPPEDWEAYFAFVLFFENMGLLLKRNLIKIDLLDDLMSGAIIQAWEKVKPITLGYRNVYGPAHAEWFEYSYRVMKSRLAKVSA